MVSIIILAAGAGTRMQSNIPKVLHTLSGQPLIYYTLQESLSLSDDVHIVLYHGRVRISEYLNNHFRDRQHKWHIHIQDYDNYPGTAGAIMGVQVKYEQVILINGDMPLIQAIDLQAIIDTKCSADMVIAAMQLREPRGYGRLVVDDNGNIRKIVEEKDTDTTTHHIQQVNAGAYRFHTALLDKFLPQVSHNNAGGEYYITDLLEIIINAGGEIAVVNVKADNFKGINNQYELALADEIMQNRLKQKLMLQGIRFELPHTTYIDEQATINGQSIIEQGVKIQGKCTISNSHIKAHTIIEQAVIVDSIIGPMARIRPQSNIYQSSIGNFVEIKKSTLQGVKAGHLSYIGDTKAKQGVNFGAGFIACNYDGKKKHTTTIGKNVFIGSGTQFIAPIVIEDDVIIGAGSTISQNIKKGTLALTRPALKEVKNFFYRFFKVDT